MIGDRFVGEIAGGDDMWKRRAALAAHPKTFGQVDLDEVAISSAKPAERVQSLYDSRTMRPPRAYASSQGDNCNTPCGKGIQTNCAVTPINVVRLDVLNKAGYRQAVLRQADPPGKQILADLLVLQAVESEVVEKCLERSFLIPSPIVTGRQHMIE
jgi:hypothetical protein